MSNLMRNKSFGGTDNVFMTSRPDKRRTTSSIENIPKLAKTFHNGRRKHDRLSSDSSDSSVFSDSSILRSMKTRSSSAHHAAGNIPLLSNKTIQGYQDMRSSPVKRLKLRSSSRNYSSSDSSNMTPPRLMSQLSHSSCATSSGLSRKSSIQSYTSSSDSSTNSCTNHTLTTSTNRHSSSPLTDDSAASSSSCNCSNCNQNHSNLTSSGSRTTRSKSVVVYSSCSCSCAHNSSSFTSADLDRSSNSSCSDGSSPNTNSNESFSFKYKTSSSSAASTPLSSSSGSSSSIRRITTRNTIKSTAAAAKQRKENEAYAIKMSLEYGEENKKASYSKQSGDESPSRGAKDKDKLECKWAGCCYSTRPALSPSSTNHASSSFVNMACLNEALIVHLNQNHILSQQGQKKYRCLWVGCKVYGKESLSFNWLKMHVIEHVGKRPYICIFNGCNRRFRTEPELERHTQLHLGGAQQSANLNGQSSLSPIKTRQQKHSMLNSAQLAIIHKLKMNKQSMRGQSNGTSMKHSYSANDVLKSSKTGGLRSQFSSSSNLSKSASLNNRLQRYTNFLKGLSKKRKAQLTNAESYRIKFKKAQFKDFVDACSLKVVDDRLKKLKYQSGTLTFTASIIGSKINSETKSEMFLIEWTPKNIIQNEWIEKEELDQNGMTKQVHVNDLHRLQNVTSLNPLYQRHRFRCNRRK